MDLTDTHRPVRDRAGDCADTVIRPVAADLDRDDRFPAEIHHEMGGPGRFGSGVPEDRSGPGVGTPTAALMIQDLGRGYSPVAAPCGRMALICTLLVRQGPPDQRDRWLADVISAKITQIHDGPPRSSA